jgi:Zn-dependent peptidase ImmA (M78 family)/DNA-binding XRE family transcriptional regulator
VAPSVRAKVKPELLRWARESAGYTIDQVAKRVAVDDERVRLWEVGDAAPTIAQLQTLADIYKRPLSVFYLQTVPENFQPMRDFRKLPGVRSRTFSPDLVLEIRLAHQRRQLAIELIEENGEEVPVFKPRAALNGNAEDLGEDVRAFLNVTGRDRAEWRSDQTGYAFFNGLRERMEARGILVFQSSRVDPDEVSGFAIAEDRAPAVVVTRRRTPVTRRTFSLMHEFVHVMLRQTGVSDFDLDVLRPTGDQKVEMFCNRVAAAILLPQDSILGEPLVRAHPKSDKRWSDDTVAALARAYGVSREAIVRRLLTLGLASRSFYQEKRTQYLAAFRALRDEQEEETASTEFRTNPPRDALHNFGKPLVQMILQSYYSDRLSLSEVSGCLGIRTRHIPTLEKMLSGQ